MNHLKAREIAIEGVGIGLYRYTSSNNGRVRAIGFCAGSCPGHPTEEEARLHYKEYLLKERYRPIDMIDYKKCRMCGAWTRKAVELNSCTFVLCPKHRTKETVASLLSIGESWES